MHGLRRAWSVLGIRAALAGGILAAALGCDDGSNDGGGGMPNPVPGSLEDRREFRAIAGVSMGAYGAMNIGTKHPELFGVIGSLGGPVDMTQLMRQIVDDNLEVKAQTEIPRAVGSDFTFDHLAPYPDRDTRLEMIQDLVIAFGNFFLHHPDPAARYLASDSQPAEIQRDDRFDEFTPPDDPRGFLDGGDENEDGLRQVGEEPAFPVDVLLLASESLPGIAPDAEPQEIGGRSIADLNGDDVFDVGDGLIVNVSEPITGGDDDLIFEPDAGEDFEDVGLDGVAGTGDFGEGNGEFDYDPDRAHWLEEDPLTRLASRTADEISEQKIYMDVGTEDPFEFESHYEAVVDVLRDRGLEVLVQDGFDGSCANPPEYGAPYVLVRYEGGHIGIPSADDVTDSLLEGDVCGGLLIWERLLSLLGFLDEQFPEGFSGPAGIDIDGDIITRDIVSPALGSAGNEVSRRVVIYRPPAFHNTDDDFPIVYFLGGYGQAPGDYERIEILLDLLINTGQLDNMYFVFIEGAGGKQGSFYVDHVIPHDQVPDASVDTGQYETSFIEDLLPEIEDEILEGRIKS